MELERHLVVLDEAISAALDGKDAQPSAVAALVRERRITLTELASVPASAGRSKRDELEERRRLRREAAAAAAQAPAGGRVKRGR